MMNEGIYLVQFSPSVCLTAAAMLIFIGLYCMWIAHNLIRVLIGMELMLKGVTLILAAAGYHTGNTGVSQAIVITLIVVEVVVITVAAGIVIGFHRKSGSLDARRMNRLKG